MANENIDFVTDTILNSESPFVLVWPVKNCRAKEFASYFKTRDCYTHTEPVEKQVAVIIKLANQTVKTNIKSFDAA